MYLKLKYGDFLLIDIVYENGPIKFFCISAVLMLDVSIDTGLSTFLHLISLYKYSRFVMFDIFDRQGTKNAKKQKKRSPGSKKALQRRGDENQKNHHIYFNYKLPIQRKSRQQERVNRKTTTITNTSR